MSEIDIRVDLESSNPDKVLQEARRAVDKVNKFPDLVTEKPAFVERKSSTFPVMEIGVFGNVSRKPYKKGLSLSKAARKSPWSVEGKHLWQT